MKNKTTILVMLSLAIILTSCMTFKEVGRLNMVSCRNIDSHTNYQLMQKNVEYTKKELRKVRSASIEEAVDAAVKKVDGGEYLMNVKIKMCVKSGFYAPPVYYYAVEGDVWGVPAKK